MPSSDQGVTRDRYTLIPRTLIFLTRGERVLLLRGAPHKRLWANRYNGVGGHIERGEDVLTSARRELAEETGLKASDLWLCGVITVDTGQDTGISIYVLKGDCPIGEVHASSEGTLEWVAFAEALEKPLVEDLYQLLPRVLQMQPGDPPFSAIYHYDQEGKMVVRFSAETPIPSPLTPLPEGEGQG
jgi:8-oxo-dGTP diphosphatase